MDRLSYSPSITYDYLKVRTVPQTDLTIHVARPKFNFHAFHQLGKTLIALSIVGFSIPLAPRAALEAKYAITRVLPTPALPLFHSPALNPVNHDFSLVIPKISVNAPIIPSVDPAHEAEYIEVLKTGIAHASTSFFPDQNGTIYLFSHSVQYDWLVNALNAQFYLAKNLAPGDEIYIFYRNHRYTYNVRETRIVNPSEVSYLVPSDKKSLILETCYPPGSLTQRLLIFADFTQDQVLKSD